MCAALDAADVQGGGGEIDLVPTQRQRRPYRSPSTVPQG